MIHVTGYGAEIATSWSGCLHRPDAPVRRLTGPDVPAVPFSHPMQDWFMPSVETITAAIRDLAAY
jgi:2-oxoisovalerate dehydrogenase E1 component beta subunit